MTIPAAGGYYWGAAGTAALHICSRTGHPGQRFRGLRSPGCGPSGPSAPPHTRLDYFDYIDDMDQVDDSDIKDNAAVAPSPAPGFRSGASGSPGRPLAFPAPRNGGRSGGIRDVGGREPPPTPRSSGLTLQRPQGSGRTSCRVLGQPAGDIWGAADWRGRVPQHFGPTGSARHGVMGRPHGRQRCGSRDGRGEGRCRPQPPRAGHC